MRNNPLLGPYSRTMSRAMWWPWGGGGVSYERGTPIQGDAGWRTGVACPLDLQKNVIKGQAGCGAERGCGAGQPRYNLLKIQIKNRYRQDAGRRVGVALDARADAIVQGLWADPGLT